MNEATAADLPLGFRFAAGYAGIRKEASDDLALMVSDTRASAAAVFTRNEVRAAPVIRSVLSMLQSGGTARAIVANAGNANCAAPWMEEVALATARKAAALAGVEEHQVLLASTGVIGEPMEIGVIPTALPRLWAALSRDQFEACARAIMTTDTVPKIRCEKVETADGTIRLAGMAKGAGMIMPDMATMLSFLFTDAAIEPQRLKEMLQSSVNHSFNCVTVDSDTSTNDTVYLLASGASNVRVDDDSAPAFQAGLDALTRDLAIDIVRDGEGARKLAEITVEGMATDWGAKQIAMAVANSPLVKTALAGADPNWGRMLAAAGKSGALFLASHMSVFVNGVQVCADGVRADYDEPALQRTMEGDEISIRIAMRDPGPGFARAWTCDLTEDYVRINADYRT